MATSYSPKIITDGLVLCLDAADKKSLLAPPTTNLANNSNGTINWTTVGLGATVRTQSTVDANSYHYRFVLDKGSDNNAQLRFAFDHTNLTNGETYIMSYKYKITSGSGSFYITDFCDQSVTRVTTDIGDGWYYETAYGTRSSYDETYDFFDALATENMTVDIKEIQVEHTSASSPLATPFVSYQRQWKDRAGSNNGAFVSMNDQSNFSSEGRGSLIFDGTEDYAEVADQNSLNLTTAMSFEFVVKPDSSQSNPYPRLIDKSVYLLHLTSTSPFGIYQNISTSGGLRQTGISSVVTAGNWNHIVCTYDGQYGKVYVDAELVKTRDFGSVLACNTSSSSLKIAGDGTTSRPLNGEMPISKIYNKVLTAAEILQNYNATKGRFGL